MSDCTEAPQPPTCLKPYGVALPPLSPLPSVRADHIPHQRFPVLRLGLCVHLSLFIYLCAVCLLTYLLIHYLLMDEKCCSYQFTHLLSIVSSPACRGPRSPSECSLTYLPLWNRRECWGWTLTERMSNQLGLANSQGQSNCCNRSRDKGFLRRCRPLASALHTALICLCQALSLKDTKQMYFLCLVYTV